MSRPTPDTEALYRLLQLLPASYPGRDGVQIVREALDDTQFIRDLVKELLAGLHDGGTFDDAELGRRVRERIFQYAESCPAFDDNLREDEAARKYGAGA